MRRPDKKEIIGIIAAVVTIVINLIFFMGENIFWFIIGISLIIGALPFVVNNILASSKERENEEMFLEFARNLVESVKSGTPISKSIINVRKKNFGTLSPYIEKLANQISLGIPVKAALENFAKDVGSVTISRAINLISQAEKAGGNIESILESVAKSIAETEKLKKERKAAIYNLVVQGYIIFLVFIVIMLVMQFKILAMTTNLMGGEDIGGFSMVPISAEEMGRPFLFLLVVQGFFAGLVIGKLAEGSIKSGIKHSFILALIAILASTGASIFL